MRIVITGTPGVGKHTIAKIVSEHFGYNLIDLTSISKEEGLFEENEGIIEVDTDLLGRKLVDKVSNEFVIVGHLAPYVLDESQIDKIVILRRSPYELISVYQDRNYSKEKIQENIESEILGIISYDVLKKFGDKSTQIEIKKIPIRENSKKVIDAINGNDIFDKVDWLDEVAKNNELRKFFSY